MKNLSNDYGGLGKIDGTLWDRQMNINISNRFVDGLSQRFSIRLMNFRLDPLLINHWVNIPYSFSYWGMKGSTAQSITQFYKENIRGNKLYPFMISYGDLPIAMIELYHPGKSELSPHITDNNGAMGIHTLMAPPRYLLTKLPEKVRNLSMETLITALKFAFSFEEIKCIFTDPHINNFHANILAKKMGFQFLKEVQLTEKKANLFCFEKSAFIDRYLSV